MLLSALAVVLAYLIGSVSGGLLLGRVMGKGDLRSAGSGNTGATNALRTGGAAYGIAVLLVDVAKGVIAVLVLPQMVGAGAPAWLPYVCGATAVAGHVWPVYFGFTGGKGAATLIGVLFSLMPVAVLPAAAVWIFTLLLSGFVGLSTLLGMTTVLLATAYLHAGALASAPVVFALAMWLLVMLTHRGNIRRMLDGNENRFEKAMLLRRQRWS